MLYQVCTQLLNLGPRDHMLHNLAEAALRKELGTRGARRYKLSYHLAIDRLRFAVKCNYGSPAKHFREDRASLKRILVYFSVFHDYLDIVLGIAKKLYVV